MNLLLAALLVAVGCGDGVEVRRAEGARFDIVARNAPISRVIDCLAQTADFRVVLDPGVSLDQPVSVQLAGQTPARAIAGILEGSRLNYAYTTDRTASRVLLLMISARAAGPPERNEPPPLIRSVPPAIPGLRMPPATPSPAADEDVENSEPPVTRGGSSIPRDGGASPPRADPASTPRPSPDVPLYPSPRPLSPLTLSDAGRVRSRSVR